MDVSALEYEEWVSFVFDHPVDDPPWHFSDEWAYEVRNPHCVLKHITRLFATAGTIRDQFPLAQLNQGFWFIPGPNGMLWTILLPSIPWEYRKACIQKIISLFDQLLATIKLESATYMWWDSVITYTVWDNKDLVSDKQVLGEIIDIMARLAKHPSEDVRTSALHGAEHLAAIVRKENDSDIDHLLRIHGLASVA